MVCIAPPIKRNTEPEPDKPEPPQSPKKDPEVDKDDINPLPLQVTTRPPTGDNTKQSADFPLNPHIRLDCDDIEDIMRMLDSLYNDCMGKRLIGSIYTDMTICQSDTMQSGATYGINSRTITLSVNPIMIDMIEELTHCYQYSTYGNNRATHGLNNEIEAKICWSIYVERHGGDLLNYDYKFGKVRGIHVFKDLVKYYEPGIEHDSYDNLNFYNAYSNAVTVFRNSKSDYANPEKYPYSHEWNLSSLDYLMQDC